jgi:hypothetical protein
MNSLGDLFAKQSVGITKKEAFQRHFSMLTRANYCALFDTTDLSSKIFVLQKESLSRY